MILNARQIFVSEKTKKISCPLIIMLAIKDVTEMMNVAEMLARHTNQFTKKLTKTTQKLETQIKNLEKEIADLKNKN